MKIISLKKTVYLIFVIAVFLFLLFNEFGIIKYLKLKNEIDQLSIQLDQTEDEISRLNSEIDSLKNNFVKIEKVAREKYHMLDKDERAIKVKKNNQP